MIVQRGSTDLTIYLRLRSVLDGAAATGLTVTDLDLTYIRDRSAAVTADLVALGAADAGHADNGAVEVSSAGAPGVYRVDLPDAAIAAGSDRVQVLVTGAAIDPAATEIELVAYDPAEPFGGGNVDSTGTETITRDEAIEAILAVVAGRCGGGSTPEYKGRDGVTTIVANTLTGAGVRTASEIHPA